MSKNDFFPSLPLRDIVVFPNMIVPLFVGRDKSIKALNEVMKNNKKIILITQKNAEVDDPGVENLYSFGCEGKILQLLKSPDGTVKILIEGMHKVRILECKNDKEYLKSSVEIVIDKVDSKEDLLALTNKPVNRGWGPKGRSATYSIWLYKGGGNCHHYFKRIVYKTSLRNAKSNIKSSQIISDVKAISEGFTLRRNSGLVAKAPKRMKNNGFLNPR